MTLLEIDAKPQIRTFTVPVVTDILRVLYPKIPVPSDVFAGFEFPATVKMQVSVIECPVRFHRDHLPPIFPTYFKTASDENRQMYILPTFQKTVVDLVGVGEAVEQEKKERLQSFFAFALHACHRIRQAGYWADFTDPASGMADSISYYPDVHASQQLLGYEVMNVGCCSLLLHPTWGTFVYPGTVFCDAPLETLLAILSSLEQ